MYCNDLSGLDSSINNVDMNADYKNYVYLRFQLWHGPEDSSETTDISYFLKPYSTTFIYEGVTGYYECKFEIDQDCADSVNSYYLGNVFLIFPEIIDFTVTRVYTAPAGHYLYNYDITHREGLNGCSLNKFYGAEKGIDSKNDFPYNRMSGYIGSFGYHSFKSLFEYREFSRGDGQAGTILTQSSLRNVAWEVIAPEGTETTDYYVEVESDGKMKVAIPNTQSTANNFKKFNVTIRTEEMDFNIVDNNILTSYSLNIVFPDPIEKIRLHNLIVSLNIKNIAPNEMILLLNCTSDAVLWNQDFTLMSEHYSLSQKYHVMHDCYLSLRHESQASENTIVYNIYPTVYDSNLTLVNLTKENIGDAIVLVEYYLEN